MEENPFLGVMDHSRTDSQNPSVADSLICSSLLFVLTVESNVILKRHPSGNTVFSWMNYPLVYIKKET